MGVVPPHQDWTFVDEVAVLVGDDLVPVDGCQRRNGALGLIKGSHRFYDHVRPSPSPQYSPPFKDQLAAIFPVYDGRAAQGRPGGRVQQSDAARFAAE